jgi:hypothetical protein
MRSQIASLLAAVMLAGIVSPASAVEVPRFKVSVPEHAQGKQLHVRRAHQLAAKQCAAEGFELATPESRMPIRECAARQGAQCARWERSITFTCGVAYGTSSRSELRGASP